MMQKRYIFSMKKTGKYRKSPMTNKHKVAFPKLVREVIMTSDIVLEILDARFIDKTRNLEMESFVKEQGKKLIYIINKVDLVDLNELKRNYDLFQLHPYIFFSAKQKTGRARLRTLIKIEMKRMKITHPKGRVGVIGYPNTGKSTIINILSGKKGAGTSPEAGFTKVNRKVRFSKDIIILDTPGVFQEKEHPNTDVGALKKHATIGVKTFTNVKDPDFVVAKLMKENPGLFERYYEIAAEGDTEILLTELGIRRKLLKKGGEIDMVRAGKEVLKDWQEGKIRQ